MKRGRFSVILKILIKKVNKSCDFSGVILFTWNLFDFLMPYFSSPSNGYFLYLSNNFLDTVNKYIVVTASNCISEAGPESIVINRFYRYHSFETGEQATKQWVMLNMKNSVFGLERYCIHTSDNDPNAYHHLKSWRLYGSNDNKNWDMLDEKNNSQALNVRFTLRNFEIPFNKGKFYKHFLLYQHNVGFTGRYGFSIRYIDFFGTLDNLVNTPNHQCQLRLFLFSKFYLLFIIEK